MKILARSIGCALVFCSLQIQILGQQRSADLVIFNANIRTMDRELPNAQALAVLGNRIIAVGTNKRILEFTGKSTKSIDADGRLILPGFNDSHVHFLGIGNRFFTIDLKDISSPNEFAEKIKLQTRFLPKNHWILGGFWNNENWKPRGVPSKELIDPSTPNNPVFLYNQDTEIALVNSVAIKLAGFAKTGKTIANGVIERDSAGEPTGIIRGQAIKYLKAFTPKLTDKQESAAAQIATNYAASLGITSVQDVHSDDIVEIYQELETQGKLKTRVYDCVSLTEWKTVSARKISRASGSAMIRQGCLKHYSDGDFDVIPDLLEMMIPADKANLQIMMHAIGSRANQVVLDAFEMVETANGKKDRRFRIEHAHNMRAQDIKRFGATKTIASMQPQLFFGGVFNNSQPYRSLLDSGALISFGSDAAMTDFNPLLGIYAAVDRRNSTAPNIQTVTVEEAVRAYTIGSAFAEFQEDEKGALSIGKLADIVMLSDDIFTIPPDKIPSVKVLMTIVDGKIVYEYK